MVTPLPTPSQSVASLVAHKKEVQLNSFDLYTQCRAILSKPVLSHNKQIPETPVHTRIPIPQTFADNSYCFHYCI